MTSGRGIMHEEMPRRSPEGNIFGFQLWVNLPAALKMGQPRYQEVQAAEILLIESDGAHIRLVAGKIDDTQGPVGQIAADPIYMEVQLDPGASFIQAIPAGHTTVAYVFEGCGEFGLDESGQGEIVEAVHMLVFEDGEALSVQAAPDSAVRFMLMAGAPFGEPIVPYGPFVMNTVTEIQQALDDLRNGVFVQ
jgi:redox-sensitive bicupin YhaK (pirin superfamily)